MQRIISLSKFRNFGLDKEEYFILNQTLEKGKMGDLVIIIGPNNSGKSNILDAISKAIESKRIDNRDISTLSYEEEYRNPCLSFGYRDKENNLFYKTNLHGISKEFDFKEDSNIEFNYDKEIYEFKSWNPYTSTPTTPLFNKYLDDLMSSEYKSKEKFISHVNEFIIEFENIYRSSGNFNYCNNVLNNLAKKNNCIINNLIKNNTIDCEKKANDFIEEKFSVPFFPKVFIYEEESISKNALSSHYSNIEQSNFFQSIFKTIDIDCKKILTAYDQYFKYNNKATLNKMEKEINNKITILNDQFNKMYFSENEKYKFSISLEKDQISFAMARGIEEDPIMIEYQSTGFCWFFNLYFNFLCTNELNPGDIIIMDEPATNLHPQGQKELRDFIKNFAIKNDLTFVIATHSPFLIDIDNFDELRVVSTDNNRAKISNLFAAVNMEDPDSLLPIKESLTIKQNVLYDIDTEVIWVEGITDYNYLTMFKRLLKKENIAFLPFQGVGTDDTQQKEIIQKLVNIKFYKRNILVDGDKAGKAMRKNCKDTVFDNLICISDLSNDQKFTEIEDLFSKEDKEKFGILIDNNIVKKASLSSIMKKTCKLQDFSEETINNFENLFNLLME